MTGWRDIATAPRDGSYILVWNVDEQRMAIASWERAHHCWVLEDSQDIWHEGDSDTSHWQALPNPPAPDALRKPTQEAA